tara:strand:+ start:235 stop:639 length:405 start_codon:yes stop_codon:yes gene_type:complete
MTEFFNYIDELKKLEEIRSQRKRDEMYNFTKQHLKNCAYIDNKWKNVAQENEQLTENNKKLVEENKKITEKLNKCEEHLNLVKSNIDKVKAEAEDRPFSPTNWKMPSFLSRSKSQKGGKRKKQRKTRRKNKKRR